MINSNTLLLFLKVAALCAACSSARIPTDTTVQTPGRTETPANVTAREPTVGMGISDFHDLCGPSTDGMATEGTMIVMPYKPRNGRKPECVGLFYFENFRLTKIEKVAPDIES